MNVLTGDNLGDTGDVEEAILHIKNCTELCGLEQLQPSEDREIAPQIFPSHDVLCDRVRKTLYYGRMPPTDRPSLPLTQLAVEQFADVGLTKLARLDMARAADMSREACAGPTSLVLALIYLDRLKKQNPQYLKTISSADLFLVSMMVASKFIHDDGEEDEVFNDEWAKSGNIDVKDFNRLEVDFLSAIDWRVNVPLVDFDAALEKIEKDIAYREVQLRGWASYSDLCVLSRTPHIQGLWRLLTDTTVRVTTVCMAAYAASLLTLLGAASLLNQTPFGPTAVADSIRVLSTPGPDDAQLEARSELDATTSPTDKERVTGSSGGVIGRGSISELAVAELMAASLLLATLPSTSDQSSDDQPNQHTYRSQAYPHQLKEQSALNSTFTDTTSTTDYRSRLKISYEENSRIHNGTVDEGLDPPVWILERMDYIPQATASDDSQTKSSSLEQLLELTSAIVKKEVDELQEKIVRGFAHHWSHSMLGELMMDVDPLGVNSPQAKTSTCPLLGWGRGALLHTKHLSILV